MTIFESVLIDAFKVFFLIFHYQLVFKHRHRRTEEKGFFKECGIKANKIPT